MSIPNPSIPNPLKSGIICIDNYGTPRENFYDKGFIRYLKNFDNNFLFETLLLCTWHNAYHPYLLTITNTNIICIKRIDGNKKISFLFLQRILVYTPMLIKQPSDKHIILSAERVLISKAHIKFAAWNKAKDIFIDKIAA